MPVLPWRALPAPSHVCGTRDTYLVVDHGMVRSSLRILDLRHPRRARTYGGCGIGMACFVCLPAAKNMLLFFPCLPFHTCSTSSTTFLCVPCLFTSILSLDLYLFSSTAFACHTFLSLLEIYSSALPCLAYLLFLPFGSFALLTDKDTRPCLHAGRLVSCLRGLHFLLPPSLCAVLQTFGWHALEFSFCNGMQKDATKQNMTIQWHFAFHAYNYY